MESIEVDTTAYGQWFWRMTSQKHKPFKFGGNLTEELEKWLGHSHEYDLHGSKRYALTPDQSVLFKLRWL